MDLHDSAQTLASFLSCDLDSASALAMEVTHKRFQAGTLLCHQGDRIDSLWLILEGTVQLQALSAEGQSATVSTFGPGELVGGKYDAEPQEPFDSRALTDVETYMIPALRLHALLEGHPDLAKGLARIYSGQLRSVLDRLAARITLSARGRFYRELLRAADEENTISPAPVVAAIALTAQTTRETGSRALSVLERRGIVDRKPNALVIRSRRMLEELIV